MSGKLNIKKFILKIPCLTDIFKASEPKKNLYVHIGYGKTGTSALQNFFYGNRSLLNDMGISYPDYGIVSGAHHLLSPYRPEYLVDRFNFLDTDEWLENLKSDPNNNILISSELIASSSAECIAEFCRKLKSIFNVRVVVYLRRQDDAFMANYNQMVKAGCERWAVRDVVASQSLQYDYLRFLSPWEKCLGRKNVIVRPYDKRQFYKSDICFDFLFHVFSIDAGSFDRGGSCRNSNPRLSVSALEYKRGINNLTDKYEISDMFVRALLAYSEKYDLASTLPFSDNALLSGRERSVILNYYLRSNKRLSKKYNRKTSFFSDSLLDSAFEHSSTARAEFIEITKFIKDFDLRLYELLISLCRNFDSQARKDIDIDSALAVVSTVELGQIKN